MYILQFKYTNTKLLFYKQHKSLFSKFKFLTKSADATHHFMTIDNIVKITYLKGRPQ